MQPERRLEQQYIEVAATISDTSRRAEQLYAEMAINQQGAVESPRHIEQAYIEAPLNKIEDSFRNIEQLYLEVAMPRRPALSGWGILVS